MKTVDVLFEESGLTYEAVAEKTGLAVGRVEAIATGRWTPSPSERKLIAESFAVAVDQISWGHSVNPRNVRYRRLGLEEEF